MTLMSSPNASLLSSLLPFSCFLNFYINYHPFCLACTPSQNTNFPPHLYSARLFSYFLSFPSSLISPPPHPSIFLRTPSLSSPASHFARIFLAIFSYTHSASIPLSNSTDCCQKRGEFCLTGEVKMQTQLVGTQSQIPHYPPTHTHTDARTHTHTPPSIV